MSGHGGGFGDVTRLATARKRLLSVVDPVENVEDVALDAADGRVLAGALAARRDVPGYDRAAMDGYAVRAADTHGAGERAPIDLRVVGEHGGPDCDEQFVDAGRAAPVHTGSPVPDGADAVVKVEVTEVESETDGAPTDGATLSVFDAVAAGENVAPAGEDVTEGEHLFDAGHRLRPSDLSLLKASGHRSVAVRERPSVAVIPTGEELVERDPGRGETVETNGLAVSRLVERWGGAATYREVVTDDESALAAAIERDCDHDLVVTTGGSSVGERDLVPDVVDDLGEVLVHGVAVKPGHPVGFGVVDDTPVLTLPGYPVSCLVTAAQMLKPAVAAAGGFDPSPPPTTEAALARKVHSEPGVRSFVRVRYAEGGDVGGEEDRDGEANSDVDEEATDRVPTVEPVRTGGAGVLSSVTEADGWVVVPESAEGIPAGEVVAVEDWESFQ